MFPEQQIEFQETLDGLLLGDGSLEASSVSARLIVPQSGPRQPWVRYLYDTFSSYGLTCNVYSTPPADVLIKGKQCSRKASSVLRTAFYPQLHSEWSRWYPNGEKHIPVDASITPRAIAQWYMGDGTVAGRGYRVYFCTDGFLEADVDRLVARLRATYGWHPIRDDRNRIRLCRTEDRRSLVEMVRPFVVPCFEYKLRVQLVDQRYKITPILREQIEGLRALGWGLGRIASELKLSKSGVNSALRRWARGSVSG